MNFIEAENAALRLKNYYPDLVIWIREDEDGCCFVFKNKTKASFERAKKNGLKVHRVQ